MKITNVTSLIIIAISFGICFYFYPQMSSTIASHWDSNGQVNGYLSKFWGLFLMPIVSLGLFLLFLLIPWMEPLKENFKQFRKYFDMFALIIILFFFYIFLLTVCWNLGGRFNMMLMISPAIGAMFYYAGILIEKSKRNWFIGIRTPWTLSSDKVWEKTHKLGGFLFKMSGVLGILGMFFGSNAIWFLLIPVLFTSIYTIVFSYFEYRKESAIKRI